MPRRALKVQKKYAAQTERLKSKIVALQRDLVQAKATPPAPIPTVSRSAPAPTEIESAPVPLSNKKRRAPAEFDPSPLSSTSSAPLPRAIVATRPVSTSSLPLDKENTTVKPRPASMSTKKVDSVVPLKAEHQPTQRAALRQVDENSNSATPLVTEIKVKPPTTSASSAGGGNHKLDALKAKLAAQKKRTRSGLSSTPSLTGTS
ncbi:hypothetical protein JCM16303_005056 [Sporobolomyces ruberrimus]